QGHRPVPGIDRDARITAAEKRVTAVDPFQSGAAAAGLALVAGEWFSASEISAAGSLQQVVADPGHVAQLLRGRPPQRFRERWIIAHQAWVRGDVTHACHRAEDQLTAASGVDLAQIFETRDVHEAGRHLDLKLHQIVESRASGKESSPRPACGNGTNGLV